MERVQRILYLERRRQGSVRAFSRALEAALEHGATVTVTGVSSVRLARLVELARPFDVPVRALGCRGSRSVAELAAGHDLVVTVGRSGGGLLSPGHDSVERELLRSCACPVWLLHPAQSGEVGVVLAAVDVASDRDALNQRILRSAARLATGGAGRLYVVHCWSVVGESLLASRTRGGSRRGAERALEAAARRRRRRIESLLAETGVRPAGVFLRKGEVVPGVREAAWRLEADTVVVGTVGRRGLAALLPGNTAERLVGRVAASVLVVPERSGPAPSTDRSVRSDPLGRSADPRWPRRGEPVVQSGA